MSSTTTEPTRIARAAASIAKRMPWTGPYGDSLAALQQPTKSPEPSGIERASRAFAADSAKTSAATATPSTKAPASPPAPPTAKAAPAWDPQLLSEVESEAKKSGPREFGPVARAAYLFARTLTARRTGTNARKAPFFEGLIAASIESRTDDVLRSHGLKWSPEALTAFESALFTLAKTGPLNGPREVDAAAAVLEKLIADNK